MTQCLNVAAGLSSAVTFEKSCDHGKQSTFRPRNSLDCGIQTSSELAKYNEGEYLDDQENEPDEGVRSIEFEATEGQEEIIDDEQLRNSNDHEDGCLEDQYNEPDQGMQQLGHSNDSGGSVEAVASEKTVSSPIKAVLDFQGR